MLLATLATAWQVTLSRCTSASLRGPQPSTLQPRVRTGARRCAQGATGAYGYARVLTGTQQVPHSRRFRTPAAQTGWRDAQLVIKRCTLSARANESCREAGRMLFATLATAWQVTLSRCTSASQCERAAAAGSCL
jgi:hypothetical protein